jgi:hypothetical protein
VLIGRLNKSLVCFREFFAGNVARTKAMKILTDLNANLLKTVNVVILMKRFYQLISFELQSAVEAGGECRCFLLPAGARKQ